MSSTVMPIWVTQRAKLTPERNGLIFKGTSYTFQDIYEEAKKWANLLYQKGIRNGDHVGIWMNNNAKTVFIIHALQLIGAKTILLNRKLHKEELFWQLDNSRTTCLIHDGDRAAIDGFSICEIQVNEHEPTFIDIPDESFLQDECSMDDVCSVMYTSGTTGKPKGVLQTYGNHWWSATGSALNLGLNHDDAWLAAVPLFHISGYSILMRSVIYGIPVILYERFDEAAINQELINGNATIISVVTAMLRRLLDNLDNSTYSPKFRCMLLGGGPAPFPILKECEEKNIPVFQTYGMTETSSQIVTLAPEYALTKLGSAGKPLFPCQVKIDLTAEESDQFGSGEILVKGPNVTSGYFERPDANEQAFQNGWFRTGDIGYLDPDGFLYVLDRRSDLIISGGENIYPAEIESVLLSHPSVCEAGVVGKDDPTWGQVPVAFVVLSQQVNEAAIISWLKEKIASYKVPKQIIAVDYLPRNASNKLLRKELRNWLHMK
ncbi:MAG TPA: o-succinylbenzoate--CoA ligase [Bacillus sp. (in: firmicutes)]|uniref:o-succinylbenzoate--CoA ligase n=1 Tax=Bacillus litorisediminis TaxID=2922713 RepID=UPI001FAF49D5|nr:o-succinylbenzoate--CoA ligase [Bacillus litorisediminis]HWO75683.1 o-succinylbenzoate--CoA ligase [Bacillus sp. (in: firmicutes)]